MLARRKYDLGFSVENVIYFELLRRGYSVNIGKVGVTEIDFVARKNDDILYYSLFSLLVSRSSLAAAS